MIKKDESKKISELRIRDLYDRTPKAKLFDEGQYEFLYDSYLQTPEGPLKESIRQECLEICLAELKLLNFDVSRKTRPSMTILRNGDWGEFDSNIVFWKRHINRIGNRLKQLYPDLNILKIIQGGD